MSKVYAVLQPAYQGSSENPLVFIDLGVWLYHKVTYEQVCGYSLGRPATFFDNLAQAKSNGSIVVELEVGGDGEIWQFNKIYELNGNEKRYQKVSNEENALFKEISVPKWDQRDIVAGDVTKNALKEIRLQYNYALRNSELHANDQGNEVVSAPNGSTTDKQLLAAFSKMSEEEKQNLIGLIKASKEDASIEPARDDKSQRVSRRASSDSLLATPPQSRSEDDELRMSPGRMV